MDADPQDLPPLAEVLRELRESALRQIDDLPNYKTGVELLRSRTWLRAYAKACLDLIQRTVAPYDAERQRLREALAAESAPAGRFSYDPENEDENGAICEDGKTLVILEESDDASQAIGAKRIVKLLNAPKPAEAKEPAHQKKESPDGR